MAAGLIRLYAVSLSDCDVVIVTQLGIELVEVAGHGRAHGRCVAATGLGGSTQGARDVVRRGGFSRGEEIGEWNF